MKEALADRSTHGRRQLVRAWLTFIGSLTGLMLLLDWNRQFVENDLVQWNASAVARMLSLLGFRAVAHGGMVLSDLAPIQVIGECTGAHIAAIFVAAVLAFPCSLKAKLAGLAVGVPAILALNLVRLASLVAIAHYYPRVLDVAHWLVWQSVLIFATLFLWVLWASFLTGARDVPRTA